MGVLDKQLIESRFGPLWSGKNEIVRGGRTRTLREVKRAFDLAAEDVVAIDLVELPDEACAFRFYDGDDRCIVVFVFNGDGEILEEHRAHIAEWLGDSYHDTGALAFDAEALILFLRQREEKSSTPLACRKTSLRESAAQWNLDALVETAGGGLLPCFVSVISTYCTVQAPNTGEGESILDAVGRALGAPPSTPPQAVKGGSCDGADEDEEFPFAGSMVSATWDFSAGRKAEVITEFRRLFGLDPRGAE